MPDRVTPVYVVGDLLHIDPLPPTEDADLPDAKLQVSRFVYDQPSFDKVYKLTEPGPPLTPWENLKRIAKKSFYRQQCKTCSLKCVYRVCAKWIPAIEWMPKYEWRKNMLADMIAGITIGFLNTPQGVAYALLASCPAVTGLYVSFFPLIIYFFMATSRQTSMGTDAVTCVLVGQIVNQRAVYSTEVNGTIIHPEYGELVNGTHFTLTEWSQIQVATVVSLLVGLWQLVFGLLGAGGLVVYFSDQLVQGFTCGAAIHVLTSQLKSVFGLPQMKDFYGSFKIIKTWLNFFENIASTSPATIVTGLISIFVLIFIKFFVNTNQRIMSFIRIPIPAELLIVIFGTCISYFVGLHGKYGVAIVQKIPLGMPPASVPDFSYFSSSMIGETFAVAVVTLSISITLALLFANKHCYSIDPNQEFKAMGMAKIFGSFFQCFPASVSVARTAVQNDIGGKTQIVSLVQCVIIFVVIMALGKYLEPLPKACLGAIVMVSVFKLISQLAELVKLWKLSLVDWSIFLAVFLGVVILDVDLGLAVGVGWAITTVMLRLQKPKVGALGRLPGTDIYRRTDVYMKAMEMPGIKIVRVDSPIYFANASYIKYRLYAYADLNNIISEWKKTQQDAQKEPQADYGYAYANNLEINNDEENGNQTESSTKDFTTEFRRLSSARLDNSAIVRLSEFGQLNRAFDHEEENVSEKVITTHLIIDCSEVCFVDVTGVGFLKKTQMECNAVDVEVLLACTNKPVRDMLHLCNASEYYKPHQLFVTLHDAVLYAIDKKTKQEFQTGRSTPFVSSRPPTPCDDI